MRITLYGDVPFDMPLDLDHPVDCPKSAEEDSTRPTPPGKFICPITQQVFRDPVVNSKGHCFERIAILSWLSRNGNCPLTRQPMKPSDFISNDLLRTQIKLWQRQTGQEVTVIPADMEREVVGYFTVKQKSRGDRQRRIQFHRW